MRDIRGLVALVTGGASGLGEATTRRLIEDGASVVICDLPSSKGAIMTQELGEKCAFAATDVSSEADVKNALEVVKSTFGRLDVVVNCAGISRIQKIYDFKNDTPHSLEEYEKILSVNTTGTFIVIRLAVGLMGKNQPDEDGQRGIIINTASIAALDGPLGQAAYAASKAAIVGMTLPLAKDLQNQGIRCCTIAPGIFDTPILKNLPQEVCAKFSELPPFPKRLGHPDEYADLVATLIRNSYMNGCVIRIDGALAGCPSNVSDIRD